MKEADRRQQRLGDPVQKLGHGRHERVARVDDIEGDQPGQNGRSDQQPDIKIQNDKNDVEDGTHGGLLARVGRRDWLPC